MAGLDKIISQIRKEAEDSASAAIAAARKEAEGIRAQAVLEAQAECQEIQKRSRQKVQDTLARGRSSADLKRRQGLLACKQRLIHEVLSEALKRLEALDGEEYFQTMEKLALKSALPGEGTVYFSQRDLKRLPAGFEKKLNEALKDKKAVLHISGTPREIDGGFILSYGGIEENCSFESLFHASREALQDTVQKILFS
ncbi:MAG TPA: V-type ATP synthase subunit E [Candidatus Choladousia intestinavium]|uniref:V-type proton ATPase subunit E n=1 Tax=Candidatus Choladousia intestinavium TaxID=2840727 RepID=A0A9D1ACR6_9FIRM|nr:V-type ATP synthase subunit E [Candidatus Choladousia intestinavium]